MTVVRTVTVRNLGNAATTRLAFRFEGVAFSPARGSCGDQIYPNATYALPLSTAQDEARYRLMLNGYGTTTLGITLTPFRHDFGSVSIGAKRSASWTATNTSGGAEPLDCTGFILGANDSGAFAIDSVGAPAAAWPSWPPGVPAPWMCDSPRPCRARSSRT